MVRCDECGGRVIERGANHFCPACSEHASRMYGINQMFAQMTRDAERRQHRRELLFGVLMIVVQPLVVLAAFMIMSEGAPPWNGLATGFLALNALAWGIWYVRHKRRQAAEREKASAALQETMREAVKRFRESQD